MKRILSYFMLAFMLLVVPCTVLAQQKVNKNNCRNFEQAVQRQTAHITKNLMLDDATAAEFTSLYTQYLTDLRQSMQSEDMFEQIRMNRGQRNSWTDEQIEKMIKMRFERSRKILDIREKWYVKFKQILTPRQILKMYTLERNLGKDVQQEIEKRANRKKTKR